MEGIFNHRATGVRRLVAAAALAVAVLCAHQTAPWAAESGPGYAVEWSASDPHWVGLTNHLTWCRLALLERYAAAGLNTNAVHNPILTDPSTDYAAFAANIDAVATYYVCHTNVGADGTFNDYFAEKRPVFGIDLAVFHGHTNLLPMFSVSNLHAAAGFTNWYDGMPLRSWAADTNHLLASRVERTILSLKWTFVTGCYANRLTVYKPTNFVYRTCSKRDPWAAWEANPFNEGELPLPPEVIRTVDFTNTPIQSVSDLYVDPWTRGTSIPGYESLGTFYGIGWYCRQYTIRSRGTVRWIWPGSPWYPIVTEYDDWCSVSEGYYSDVKVVAGVPSVGLSVLAEAYCSFDPSYTHDVIMPLFTGTGKDPCGHIVYNPFNLVGDPDPRGIGLIADFLEYHVGGYETTARNWASDLLRVNGGFTIPLPAVPPVYTAGTFRVFGSASGIGGAMTIGPAEPLVFPVTPSIPVISGSDSTSMTFTAWSFPEVPPPPTGPATPYFDRPDYAITMTAETHYDVKASPGMLIEGGCSIDWVPSVLLKWSFAHTAPPPLDASTPSMPDTDRDGVVSTPLPVSDITTRCGGVLAWTVESADPCLVLPVTQPVGWFAGLPVNGYLTGTRVLPYQYLDGWTRSRDGDHLAFSLNTRLVESGVSPDGAVKRAAVLRPNGSVATFQFDRPSEGVFSELGVPIGEHRFRSYVLQDLSPTNHVDREFILRFEDGTMHRFSGAGLLAEVGNANGQFLPLQLGDGVRAVPGTCGWVTTSKGCPLAASNAWFSSVRLAWSEHTNRLDSVEYRTGATVLTVRPSIRDQRVDSLSKDLLSESGSSLSGTTITFGSGLAITRTAAGATVTLRKSTPVWGSLSESFVTNSGGRVTEHTLSVNGTLANTRWTYDTDTGRYPSNQLLKASRVVRVEYPDGAERSFGYAPDTGWVTGTVAAVGNGSVRSTWHAYTNSWPSDQAKTLNLVERPLVTTEQYDTNVIGRTLYSYSGDERTVVQRCASPSGGWDALSNLVYSVTRYSATNWTPSYPVSWLDLVGQTLSQESPAERVSISVWASDSELKTVSTDSKGVTSTNQYFACGLLRSSVTLENGVVVGNVTNTVDVLGRPLVSSNGMDGTWTENRAWGTFGPARRREADGSVSTMSYFPAGGLRELQQPALGLTTTYVRDPLGNATKTTISGGGKAKVTERNVDALGRTVMTRDPVGRSNFIHDRMPFGQRVTILSPGHGDVVREHYWDGSPRFEGGLGADATLNWEYGVSNGLYHVRVLTGPVTNRQWTLTRYNLLGQSVESRRSGAVGTTTRFYDDKGRLSAERDPTGITTIYTYNSSNRLERTGVDCNGNGTLDPASNDRLVTYTREVTSRGVGEQTWTCPAGGSATAVLLACATNALDGRSGVSVNAGVTSSWSSTAWQPGGVYTNVTTYSDGRRQVSAFNRWRLKESRAIETNGVVTESSVHTVHELGYTERIDHSRRGATATRYNAAFQKESVARPGISGTSFTEYWPGTDRKKREVRTDGSIVQYRYWPNGRLMGTWDTGSYPSEQEYSEQGQRTALRTFRGGSPVTTRWVYDPVTGYLAAKRLQGLAAPLETYTYRDNGQLATVTDIRGIVKTFSCDPATGEQTGVSISDGLTAPLTNAYDRLGRRVLTEFSGGIKETFGWTLGGDLATNTITGRGQVPDVEFSYRYSGDHGGVTRQQTTFLGELAARTDYFYDGGARMMLMSNGVGEVTCGYVPGSDLLSVQTFSQRGDPKLTRTILWDLIRDVPTGMVFRINGAVVASFWYQYQTNADRIARFTLPDGTYWAYDYDAVGQLKTADRYLADGTAFLGGNFAFRYDEIGNMTAGGRADASGNPRHGFECNDLNAHVTRNWSNVFDVAGTAVTGVTVSVNDQPALRQGERWLCELAVDNGAGSVQTSLVVRAVSTTGTVDLVAERRGKASFPRYAEPVVADVAGEIVSDSRYAYGFDGNWRLVSLTCTNADPLVRITFGYYADGRRAWKKVEHWSGGTWTLRRRHQFTWDRWALVRETVDDYSVTPAARTVKTFVWALDLAGRSSGKVGQSAGCIDGLVAVSVVTNGVTSLYLPVMDHHGTVRHVVDAASERVVATFDYTPYGELVAESGDPAAIAAVPFRFQTKYYDRETGLLYFGHRYYVPSTGKWLTRDPLGEEGGLNLTQSFGGDPVNGVDATGLAAYFFGGTGNNLTDKDWSNVEILYRAWDNGAGHGIGFYVPGVFSGYAPDGTPYTPVQKLAILNEGISGKTLNERAKYMMGLLKTQLATGDKEVNIFGFSRGSLTALVFLNMVATEVKKGDPQFQGINVNQVVLFDTVRHADKDLPCDLPDNLMYTHQPLHLIAIDEQRKQFFEKDVLDVQGSLQIGFRGVHANVGGGHNNNSLSYEPLMFVRSMMAKSGMDVFNKVVMWKYIERYGMVDNGAMSMPTNNDTWFYTMGHREFPTGMFLSPGFMSRKNNLKNSVPGSLVQFDSEHQEAWRQGCRYIPGDGWMK